MRELIRKLTGAFGPSGAEEPIRKVIRAEIEPLADEIRVDPLGSLIARKQCGDGKRILLDAHMDEIGVMVTYVDEKGFARFTRIGGVYTLNHVGGRVAFADGTVGVIGIEGKRKDPNKVPKFEQLYLDVGATSRDDCPVGVGDAVLIETLRRLEQTDHDVHFVFAVQEEVGMRGAHTATYGIDPDMAIAVDVTTTGDTPEARPMAVELGKGPAIKIKDAGMIAHPAVRDLMIQQAKKAEIPYQLEVLERGTTDAAAMQLVRAGVPSGCLSVPCRYVHTPSEMVDEQDVENSVQLLLEVLQAA
ncbi:MAG: aminopeptidase [Anaerolineaceae bacterium 4572_32.2]|nr:MAG: aminopeptidase [Anaerolineaceae bacterium 4572_32.2]